MAAAQNGQVPRWGEDVLGEEFQNTVLKLPSGARATLIRHRPPGFRWPATGVLRGHAVLYVHGWSDYFFQHELARFITAAGADFYALDLRNYGRNLNAQVVPGHISSLEEYFEEFDAAHRVISQAHPRHRFVLLGHSTGGLSAALYAASRPGRVDALVLNSPWLEFQATEFGRTAISALFATGSRINPHRALPRIDSGVYTRSISSAFEGEWDYDLSWRPPQGFRVTTGFINAVFQAQAKVAKGLGLSMPVLVLLSSRDYLLPRWNPDARRADVALNVEVVARRSIDLAANLTLIRLDGALHDVFLSESAVRQQAYLAVGSWLDSQRHRLADSWLRRLAGQIAAQTMAQRAARIAGQGP